MSHSSLNLLCSTLSKLKISHVTQRQIGNYKPPRYRPPYWYKPKERVVVLSTLYGNVILPTTSTVCIVLREATAKMSEDMLTQENRQFLEEIRQDKLQAQAALESPLLNSELVPTAPWDPYTRRAGLIARKIGNYPLWMKDGKRVQTTLLQVVDNHVIKYIPPEEFKPMIVKKPVWKEQRRLGSLLIGSETIDPTTVTKDYCSLFDRVGMLPKRHLCRFMVSPHAALPTGTPLTATHFRVGDFVDVRAKTIDRGFQGVMKRWGFKGMPASHGVTKTHRRPGNIGGGGEKARVWPGTKMPGHMGNSWRILRGVKILRINTNHNVLWMLGVGIPGETGAMCYVFDTVLPLRKHKTPPPFPTHQPPDDLPLEYYDDSIHPFEEPTITFEED